MFGLASQTLTCSPNRQKSLHINKLSGIGRKVSKTSRSLLVTSRHHGTVQMKIFLLTQAVTQAVALVISESRWNLIELKVSGLYSVNQT